MAFVNEVFDATMGLMDELSSKGEAQTSDTKEYMYRTPAIMNILTGEFHSEAGSTESFLAVEEFDDYLAGIPEAYARTVLPYGLAANLLVDENPTAASFFEQRYEELMKRYIRRMPAEFESIIDVYGVGNEYGEFSRW